MPFPMLSVFSRLGRIQSEGRVHVAKAAIATARDATSDEVKDIRAELRQLKEALAETLLENRLLKKSMIADGGDDA